MTIGDANAGATDTLSITLSGPGALSGTGLSGADGSYILTGTASAITGELQALSFTPVDGVPNTSVTTTFNAQRYEHRLCNASRQQHDIGHRH